MWNTSRLLLNTKVDITDASVLEKSAEKSDFELINLQPLIVECLLVML